MKLRTYLMLLPFGTSLALGFFLGLGGLFAWGAGSETPALANACRVFAFACLFMSSAGFGMLGHAPLSHGSIALLPDVQSILLRGHLTLMGALSVVTGLIIHLANPGLPWPLAVLLMLAYLSTYLLHDGGIRNGLVFHLNLLAALAGIVLTFTPGPRQFLANHPGWIGAACLGVVGVCVQRASRRPHLRRMVLRERKVCQPDVSRSPVISPARAGTGFKIVRNMQVFFPEMSLTRQVSSIVVVFVPVVLLMTLLGNGPRGLPAALFDRVFGPSGQHPPSLLFYGFLGLIAPRIDGKSIRRCQLLLPMSRRRMAGISLVSTFGYCLLVLGSIIVLSLTLGAWGAYVSGQAIAASAVLRLLVSCLLWLVVAPLLNARVTGGDPVIALLFLGVFAFITIVQMATAHWSLVAMATFNAACIAVSHVVFYFVLKRGYARQDLVGDGLSQLPGRLAVPANR
jgi:hypothetical protein